MELILHPHPVPAAPAPVGPHGLAWAYLLDALFAEAALAGVARLHVASPHAGLEPELALRAELSSLGGTAGSGRAGGIEACALLAPGLEPVGARAWRLRYGALAPRALRAAEAPAPAGGRRTGALGAYGWRARALGVPMALGNRLRRPALADRAMFAMRASFAGGRGPSFYRLESWELPAGAPGSGTERR